MLPLQANKDEYINLFEQLLFTAKR